MDISPVISQRIVRFAVAFLPILLGMVLHELAHGYAAYRLGDPTAKLQGRLTLNPLKHLEPVGTIVFVVTALTCPFVFGWARPINVQPRYFRDPRKGMMLVSFAGPLTNFLLAIAFGALFAVLLGMLTPNVAPSSTMIYFLKVAQMGVLINLTLGWFNMLPIPTLDGGHILAGFLPLEYAQKFYAYGRYALMVIVLLMATGAFWYILGPLVGNSASLIGWLFAIPPRLL